MHELLRSTVLAAAPEAVWAVVGDFAGLADWHPGVPPATVQGGADPALPGAVRVFTVDGEPVAHERLLARSDDGLWYRYTVLDAMEPVGDYVSTLAVLPHPQGAEVRWSARYTAPDHAVPRVESAYGDGVYVPGLAALRTRFGRPAGAPTT